MHFKCARPPAREAPCRDGQRYINEKKSRLARGPPSSRTESGRKNRWKFFSPSFVPRRPCGFLLTLRDASRSEGRPHSPLGFVSGVAFRSCPRSLPGPPDARSFLPESNREIMQGNTLPPTPAPPPSRPKPSAISFGSSQSGQGTIRGSSFE